MATETNRYAKKKFDLKSTQPHKRKEDRDHNASWYDTTPSELKGFFGFKILLSACKPARIDFLWRSHPLFYHPLLSKLMTRKRYQQLMACLHLVDNDRIDERNKVAKLRPMLELINSTFPVNAPPSIHVAIDEGMVKSRSRFLPIQIYNSKKPTKWGAKLFLLAQEGTHYVMNLFFYVGVVTVDDQSARSITCKTVLRLVKESQLYPPFYLYFDNAYTSIELLLELARMNIYACGVLNQKRKHIPKDFLSRFQKLEKGEIIWTRLQGTNITVTGVYDSKLLLVASNFHNPLHIEWASRRLSRSCVK